jgi:hypothetical protein
VRGLISVGATEPHLIVAIRRCIRDGELALVDGVVGHLLSVIDATEKLVGLAIMRLCVENVAKADDRLVSVTLLDESVGLGRVGQKKLWDEKEKREGKAGMRWGF